MIWLVLVTVDSKVRGGSSHSIDESSGPSVRASHEGSFRRRTRIFSVVTRDRKKNEENVRGCLFILFPVVLLVSAFGEQWSCQWFGSGAIAKQSPSNVTSRIPANTNGGSYDNRIVVSQSSSPLYNRVLRWRDRLRPPLHYTYGLGNGAYRPSIQLASQLYCIFS